MRFWKINAAFLLLTFIAAIFIRFLYFPNNIYFGFDQARDAFAVKELLDGDLKLVGPPTSFEGLRHGVLYYYIYAPFYWIGGEDPTLVAAFLRVLNSSGVILIFALSTILFGRGVGFISAWLFAVSFEQTQFALYFNHPSFAVISILILFLGLALLIFRKKDTGLIIALLGVGLSIQFEFLLTYLTMTFILILFVFRKSLPAASVRTTFFCFITLLLTMSTFIVAEIKFSFLTANSLFKLLFAGTGKSIYKIITMYLYEMGQVLKFNLLGTYQIKIHAGFVLFGSFLLLLFSHVKKQIIFLSVWFFSAIIIYIIGGGGDISAEVIQYHPNLGLSLCLIIFVSYLIFNLWKRNNLLALSLIIFVTLANFSLIQKINPYGSMPEINAQSFMILSDEKKVLDYIYQNSKGEQFGVKAISMPFYVNTTWSYLFEWYGLERYGYLPVWNGKNALGFPGNLKVEDAQDKAPGLRFLVIEPIRGIPNYLIDGYLKEESYFSDIVSEVEIGGFKVQKRIKK